MKGVYILPLLSQLKNLSPAFSSKEVAFPTGHAELPDAADSKGFHYTAKLIDSTHVLTKV